MFNIDLDNTLSSIGRKKTIKVCLAYVMENFSNRGRVEVAASMILGFTAVKISDILAKLEGDSVNRRG